MPQQTVTTNTQTTQVTTTASLVAASRDAEAKGTSGEERVSLAPLGGPLDAVRAPLRTPPTEND